MNPLKKLIYRLIRLIIMVAIPPIGLLLWWPLFHPQFWSHYNTKLDLRILFTTCYLVFWVVDYSGFIYLLIRWFRELIHPISK